MKRRQTSLTACKTSSAPMGWLFPAHTGAGSCVDRTRRCGSSAYFPGLGELPLAFYPDLVFDKRPGKSRAYMSVEAGFKL